MKIKLKNISRNYEKRVLDKINLQIEGYNTVAIIGKSGCGKSTLLRLMTGLEKADEGQITINGYPVVQKKLKEYHRRIGIVFQQHNLFPHLSLLENISLVLEKTCRKSSEEAQKKARALLRMLHLEEESSKRPRFVSGGQAQRASIARALCTDPDLIFMDEPTAALDPILTREVLDVVLDLKQKGTRFVFVTHEIQFVRQFAEYVLFLDNGIIEEEGTVDILNQPKTKKLKDFLNRERSEE